MVVVTDGDGVVLGRLRRRHLRDEAQDSPVAEVMLAGPSTYRPNVPVEEMNSRLDEHGLHSAIVTKPDGTLLGLYVRPDGRARGSR
jgi:CBS domain-containing protein